MMVRRSNIHFLAENLITMPIIWSYIYIFIVLLVLSFQAVHEFSQRRKVNYSNHADCGYSYLLISWFSHDTFPDLITWLERVVDNFPKYKAKGT